MTIPQHGTDARYQRGCKCGRCIAAHTARTREYRARYATVPDKQIPHGTRTGYGAYRCRCVPCKGAEAAYWRGYRARKRAGLI